MRVIFRCASERRVVEEREREEKYGTHGTHSIHHNVLFLDESDSENNGAGNLSVCISPSVLAQVCLRRCDYDCILVYL